MNALELADAIEICNNCGYNLDAAKVLRQQQAEIEHLKELFEKAMRIIEK
jgi:hypothetical protein